jgi:L-fucose isomerase-like protein
MKFFTHEDMYPVFEGADSRQAQKLADEIAANALQVVEPSRKEIHDAMRFYLGIVDLLKREKANAITIDCFGDVPKSLKPAYPCISWSRLNDQGLYGVCEADLLSTMTQMLVTPGTGLPGFVSDPVIDISRNEVIHAHCVAATKMKGIDGPGSPYFVRSHLETSEGATLQVLMPSGETITCAKFTAPDRFLVSTAEVTGAVQSDRGCRTQIRTLVADAQKMLENYSGGLHRVVFYGDHVEMIERMGRLMGFEVVREI